MDIDIIRKKLEEEENRAVYYNEVLARLTETFRMANPHLFNGGIPGAEFDGAVIQGDGDDFNGFLDDGDFYRAIDLSDRIIWVAGVDGNCVHISPRFMLFTGLTKEKFRDGRWKQQVHPEDVEEAERRWIQAFTLKQQYINHMRLRRRDGEWIWMTVTARPRYRRNGKYAGYVGTLTIIRMPDNNLAR